MKRIAIISLVAAGVLAAAAAQAGERTFSAAAVPGVGIRQPGRVVISNDGRSITAFRFFGNVREALVTLRTSRSLVFHPFGAALFNSNAPMNAPLPPYLSAIMADAARTHGIDPRLLIAVARQESGWNAAAVSPVGACGIMQLMPATAKFLGVSNIFDVRENVFGGARYLRTLLDTFHGDLDLTLAAYNAGPGAVQRYNGIPPYRETQRYVKSVRAAYEQALR